MLEITASRNIHFMGTIKGLHLGWVSRRYRHMNKNLKLPNLEHLRSFHHVCTSGSIGAAVKNSGVPNENIIMLDRKGVIYKGRPEFLNNSVHAWAEAPAPLTTTLISFIDLPLISNAFIKAAVVIIAVPC